MRDLLIHRGPDDQGLFIEGNIGLGHRRLSIIDLSGGHQPMSNEDGSLWIVYNGEIYNFQGLREELIRNGHIFKTKSDTEIILHLYEEKGVECVKDFNGMFAFAIWDKKDRSLFLARDRMGVKPLYYSQTKDAFLFSSEMKSLIKSGHLEPECNDEAIFEYFIFRCVAGEATIFKKVYNLLPGHFLILRNGQITIRQYWSSFPQEMDHSISLTVATEKLEWLIEDAVKIRLVSDVPLGTFCSGGLDSSLVTAVAARTLNHAINTFSVGFHEERYDETSYARLVSNRNATIHHELRIGNKEFADLLPLMIWLNDEPLNYANSIQIYAISKLAKEFVTVVLTGEGADELVGGYPRYFIAKWAPFFNRFPKVLRHFLDNGSTILDEHRIQKFKLYLDAPMKDVLLYNSSFIQPEFLKSILNNHFSPSFSFRDKCISAGSAIGLDNLSSLLLLDQHTYLVSILNRQDKMSMGASIESRVPFLDYRIVRFCNSLPNKFKLRLWQNKYLLKQAAREYLPEKIINRKKSGFGVPIGQWLKDKNGLGRYVDLLREPGPSFADYFVRAKIIDLIEEHNAGKQNHEEILWALINFELWNKIFL